MARKEIDEIFLSLFCEKNSDGTKHLRLKGRELWQRIGRRLNEGDMHTVALFLGKHPEIKSIDLAYNDLDDEGIKILAEEYFKNENDLKYINLLHCDIHAAGLKWLSSAENLKLQVVRLAGNKLGAEGTQYIGRLIENCPTLENLDVGETDQTLESIESLLIVIEKSNLKSVNISRIIPSSYYTKYNNSILADDLGVLLKLNNSLEVLRVQKCEFDGHDVALLLGGLKVHHKLTLLDLAANRIGDHGIQILSEWLRTRPTLMGLRLASNEIGTPGAQSLGRCLPFSRIRLLDLHNNKIDDQGVSELLDSMKKSTQIRMLYIWGNVLGHLSLSNLERMLMSGTLKSDCIDVNIYRVDGEVKAAHNPSNHFRHRSYSVLDYGVPPELKIVRNKIPHPNALPRALVDFEFVDRYPPVDDNLGLKVIKSHNEDLASTIHKHEENSYS